MKKRLYKVTAVMVSTALLVTSATFLGRNQEVQAKETFQGITEIVEENSERNPFSVIEIVPGNATYTYGTGEDAVTVEVPMGVLGYYIGGSESASISQNLALLPNKDARTEYANLFLNKDGGTLDGVLKSIAAEDQSAPLRYVGYEEAYSYTISEDDIRIAIEERNPWNNIELDRGHEEVLTDRAPKFLKDGLFLKEYIPTENAITSFAGLAADAALNRSTDQDGDFDPYFELAVGETDTYNVYFKANSARHGYVISEAIRVFGNDDDILDDTPIYAARGDGVYEYVGKYGTLKNTIPGNDGESNPGDGENDPGDGDDTGSPSENEVPGDGDDGVSDNDVPSETPSDNGDDTPGEPANDPSDANSGENTDGQNGEQESEADQVGALIENVESITRKLPFFAALPTLRMEVAAVEDPANLQDETVAPADDQTTEEETPVSENEIGGENPDGENPLPEDPSIEEEPGDGIEPDGYFMLAMKYDPENAEGLVCYSVTDFNNTEASSSMYRIDPENLFVPNYDQTGCIVDTGVDPQAFCYTYLGMDEDELGLGNYDLIEGTSTPGIRVKGITIYYRGPFVNNEWFKKYVFDREFEEETGKLIENLEITYQCMTPEEFANYSPSGVGLLYLSNPDGSFIPSSFARNDFYGVDEAAHDLTAKSVQDIVTAVVENNLPVLVDGSIIRGEMGTDGTNLQVLARTLQQENVAALFAKHSDESPAEFLESIRGKDVWFNDDMNSHHVNRSIYVYNYSEATSTLNKVFTEQFGDGLIEECFKEIEEEIETENQYRKANKHEELMDTAINEAVAIKYIIAYGMRKGAYIKDEIHVLELQPCMIPQEEADKTTGDLYVKKTEKDDETYYSLYVKNDNGTDQVILSNMENPIHLTSVSTAEFVGREEDISSEYDMIYIGLATTYMNVDSSRKTVYNDSAMNGLVYSNTGDYVRVSSAISGLLGRDISGGRVLTTIGPGASGKAGLARYSGNDISEIKVRKLKEYVEAGYPLLLANDLLKNDGTVNTAIVDKNSYMYKFLHQLKEYTERENQQKAENIFRMPILSQTLENTVRTRLEWYLNLPKPTLELDESYSKQGDAQPVWEEDGKYFMEYMFYITDRAATDKEGTYDCNLYIDANSDGRFAKEEIRDEFVIQTAGGTRQFRNGEGKYELKSGKDYYAYFEVTDEYDGPLPWKLVINSNEYEGRRDAEIGCYKIHRAGSPKLRVNVLQLLPDGNPAGLWDISNSSDGMTQYLKVLLDSLEHYDVKITTMRNKQFVDALDTARSRGTDFWSEYDLVILGFSPDCMLLEDCTCGTCRGDRNYAAKSTYAAQSLVNYIQAGRSVLVSAGVVTTQVSLLPNAGGYGAATRLDYGYNMTRRLRTLIGMDRYGVVCPEDQYDAEYFIKPHDPGRNGDAPEIQGFTNILQDSATQTQDGSGFYRYLSTKKRDLDTNPLIGMGSVECINKGQLTMYPYALGDDYNFNNVSYKPFYSLNLTEDTNKDGESDVVVWYTYSNPWRADGVRSDYHVNDARDMYFMYTKGNITYINMCRNGWSADRNYMKLLVNTIIGAYEAGNHAPKVRIVDEPTISGNDLESLYVMPVEYGENYIPWDDSEVNSAKVNFYAYGVPDNTEIHVRFYCEVDDGYTGWGEDFIDVNRINWHVKQLYYGNTNWPPDNVTRTHNGLTALRDPITGADISEEHYRLPVHVPTPFAETESFKIKQNTVYQIQIPIRIMDGEESKRIFVAATSVLKSADGGTQAGSDIKSATGYDSVTLIRPQLFNLD